MALDFSRKFARWEFIPFFRGTEAVMIIDDKGLPKNEGADEDRRRTWRRRHQRGRWAADSKRTVVNEPQR